MNCRDGAQLLDFLANLPERQLHHELVISHSHDVPCGEVLVEVDDNEEVIYLVGATDDVI